MINRAVFENELFSHCQSMTVAFAGRTCARGRDDRGQRTERFPLSRNAA